MNNGWDGGGNVRNVSSTNITENSFFVVGLFLVVLYLGHIICAGQGIQHYEGDSCEDEGNVAVSQRESSW